MSRLRHAHRWGALVGVALAVVVLWWRVPAVSGAMQAMVGWVSWPWQRGSILLADQGAWLFTSKAELAARNVLLEEQVRTLASTAAQWQVAAESLPQLEALARYQADRSLPMITARVLLFLEQGSDQFLLVDKGSNAHVEVGRVVVTEDGVLVGLVEEVYPFTARLRLLTSASMRVGILPIGSSQTIAVARGMGFDRLMAEFIPRTVALSSSTIFATSGADTGIPRGLLVGRVEEVLDDPGLPHRQARLQPLTDVRRITWVGIL
jgi:rod shape-determining protein MreC